MGHQGQRVELKNINPPQDIQQAMEKQMRAERENEKRSSGPKARNGSHFTAEGQKQAAISRRKPSVKPRLRRLKGSSRLSFCEPRVRPRLSSRCRKRLPTAW